MLGQFRHSIWALWHRFCLLFFCGVCWGASPAAVVLPARYLCMNLLTELLQNPVALVQVGPGRLWVAERDGKVQLVGTGERLAQPEVVLDLSDKVLSKGKYLKSRFHSSTNTGDFFECSVMTIFPRIWERIFQSNASPSLKLLITFDVPQFVRVYTKYLPTALNTAKTLYTIHQLSIYYISLHITIIFIHILHFITHYYHIHPYITFHCTIAIHKMYCPCIVLALPLHCPCIVLVLPLYCPCIVLVL